MKQTSISNSPNLSLFPLLAYHKICNDHYRNEKWQPFEPWTCNIDYLGPSDNMNAKNFIQSSTFTALMTSILDLENSNLPIDYFTSVLPRAQYGDESAVSVGLNNTDALFRIKDAADGTKVQFLVVVLTLQVIVYKKANSEPVSAHDGYVAPVRTASNRSSTCWF